MRTKTILVLALSILAALSSVALAGFFGGSGSSSNGLVVASGRTLYYDDCSSANLPSGASFAGTGTNSYSSAYNARILGVTHQSYINLPSVVKLNSILVVEFDFNSPGSPDDADFTIFDGTGSLCEVTFNSSSQITLTTAGVTRLSSATWSAGITYHVVMKMGVDKKCEVYVTKEDGSFVAQYNFTETTNRIVQGTTYNAFFTNTNNNGAGTGAGLKLYHLAVYDGLVVATGGGSVSPSFSGGQIATGLSFSNGGGFGFTTPNYSSSNDAGLYMFAQAGGAGLVLSRQSVNLTKASAVTVAQFNGGTTGEQRSIFCHYHVTCNNGTEVQVCDGIALFQYVRNFGGGTINAQATSISQTSCTTSGTITVTFGVTPGVAPNLIQATLATSLTPTGATFSATWIDAGGSGGGTSPALTFVNN